MARRVCRADRGSLFLVAAQPSPHLWSKVAEGDVAPIRVAWGAGLAGAVAASGDGLNVADAYSDRRFDRHHDQRVRGRNCVWEVGF